MCVSCYTRVGHPGLPGTHVQRVKDYLLCSSHHKLVTCRKKLLEQDINQADAVFFLPKSTDIRYDTMCTQKLMSSQLNLQRRTKQRKEQ